MRLANKFLTTGAMPSQGMAGVITPQQKMIYVNDKFGNKNIKNQQGTTRVIYDSLPLDGRQTYQFFRGSGSRNFPFTNLDAENGKMGVGETMTPAWMSIVIFTVDPVTGNITAVDNINSQNNITLGEFALRQGNTEIVKRMRLSVMNAQFSKNAHYADNGVYELVTDLTLLPQIEFVGEIYLPAGIILANSYLSVTIEGPGGILSPQATV